MKRLLIASLSASTFLAMAMEKEPTHGKPSVIQSLKILAARPLYRKMKDDDDFRKSILVNQHITPEDVKQRINNSPGEMLATLTSFMADYKHMQPEQVEIQDLSGEEICLSEGSVSGNGILVVALEKKRQDIAKLLMHAGMPQSEFSKSLYKLFERHIDDKYSLITTFLDFNLISLKDKYDNWPLVCLAAKSKGHSYDPCKSTSIINALLLHQCDPNAREDLTGETALMLVSQEGCASCAQELIQKGAHIEAVDDEGKTAAWHAAAQDANVDAFKVLIDHNAKIDTKYKDKSLFEYAKENRRAKILRVMRIAQEKK